MKIAPNYWNWLAFIKALSRIAQKINKFLVV